MDTHTLEKFKQIWSYWQVRALILLSLFFQIILLSLGRLRKTSTSVWIQKFLWISYILADWLAVFVLTQQSRAMNDSSYSDKAIFAFWAPFLILHLGGPDTITAYSIEDNELWDRHLLGLIYALIIAIYVFFCSLPNTFLLAPTILIFLVGIIKYLERSYSLHKASAKGLYSSSVHSIEKSLWASYISSPSSTFDGILGLYYASKPYFIDAMPTSQVHDEIIYFIDKLTKSSTTAKESFEVVLTVTFMELSYVYDELYTKAIVNHSRVGYVLRAFCTICILAALSLFVMAPKNSIDKVDVVITYVLLTASVFLDAIAAIILFFSDWMLFKLVKIKNLRNWIKLLAEHNDINKREMRERRYALKEMPQLNIINNCLEICMDNHFPPRRMVNWIKGNLCLLEERKLYANTDILYTEKGMTLCTMKPVNATLEHLVIIAKYAKECIQRSFRNMDEPARFFALHEVESTPSWVVPSIVELIKRFPFDQQVLIWHISTDLCFHWKSEYRHPMHPQQAEDDDRLGVGEEEEISSEMMKKMNVCEYLSNYMIYLVLMKPHKMSTMEGDSSRMFYDVFVYMFLMVLSKRTNDIHLMMIREKDLGENSTNFRIIQMLAHLLLVLEDEERWEVVTKAWVELLILGAKNTKATMHMKQLSEGVDLLTFIWLQSKYFGIDYPIKTQHSSFMNSSPEDSKDRLISEEEAPHSPYMNMNYEDIDGLRKELDSAVMNMSSEDWIKKALSSAAMKMSSEDIYDIKYEIKAPHSPSMNMNSEDIDGIRRELHSAVMNMSSEDWIKKMLHSAVMEMSYEDIKEIKYAILIEELSTKIKSHLQIQD